MESGIQTGQAFTIHYRGKDYTCEPIERNNCIFYRVKFQNSYLYLTKATSQNGASFWTSLPADAKLKHVVHELGEVITNHYK